MNRTPTVVGVAQVIQRDTDDPLGPIELMVHAARDAAADAGAPSLLRDIGWVGVAGGAWPYRNPGQLVAAELGASRAATALASISGSAPQHLVGVAAERIARGELDVALVVGGEARRTYRRLKRAGASLPWIIDPGNGEPERFGGVPAGTEEEIRQAGATVALYALIEDALRASASRSVDEHRAHIAALWARFSEVAVSNPAAWDRRRWAAEEISAETPDNRMIAFPYTKALVANNYVDMSSAVLLAGLDVARAAGVPADRCVFPHVVTTSVETHRVVERDELHHVPALAAAGRRALALAGITADDVDHVDLYACFPSIVQMSAAALGFSLDRPLTCTGGLGFAGSPLGNAAGQSIAALIPQVRGGGWGLVHANGGTATKHAFGVYGPQPPQAFRFEAVDDVDRHPRPELADDWSGPVTIEAATVLYDREGPSNALVAVRHGDGRRLVTCTDAEVIDQTLTEGIAGRAGTISSAGRLAISS